MRGVELADHAAVEEVDPCRPPRAGCPGAGRRGRSRREDLPVVGLEQLARGLRALGRPAPRGAARRRRPPARAAACVESSWYTRGTCEPRVALEHLAHPVEVRRLHAEVELARSDSERCRRPRACRPAAGAPARCSAFSANSSSRPRSRGSPPRAVGRCTFTTTRSPPSSVARCTWPIVPAASGSGSISSNTSSHGTPSSSSITATTSASVSGGTSSCSRASSSTNSGGSRSGRVERIWPSFANVGPELLERLAQALRAPSAAVGGAALAEAVARHHLPMNAARREG